MLFLLLVVSSVFARVVRYDFDVENGQVAPDGVPRNAVLGMSVVLVYPAAV